MNFDFRTHVGINMALAADAVDGELSPNDGFSDIVADLVTEYFHSWRPYSVILARLRLLHGVRRRYEHFQRKSC